MLNITLKKKSKAAPGSVFIGLLVKGKLPEVLTLRTNSVFITCLQLLVQLLFIYWELAFFIFCKKGDYFVGRAREEESLLFTMKPHLCRS